MEGLIKIEEKEGKQLVSARELYKGLELNPSNFTKWVTNQIIENEYASEYADYQRIVVWYDTPNGGKKEGVDYALTIDFAKKLCMTSKSKVGNEIRDYFLSCEKKLKAQSTSLSQAEILLKSAQMLVQAEKRMSSIEFEQKQIEKKVKVIEANQRNRSDYMSVVAYATLNDVTVSLKEAQSLGKKATIMCKDMGFTVETIPDPRFGRINVYPYDVLETVFE